MIKTIYDKLLSWSTLNIEQKFNFVTGAIVIAMGFIIYLQDQRRIELIKKCESERVEYLNYLKTMDNEYRLLLRELNQVKNRS